MCKNLFLIHSRKKVLAKITKKPESQISPCMWQSLNPGYRLEDNNKSTHFSETFKGERKEDVDKVYFRKRDGLASYAEALFKSKHICSKK